ncbi:MAG: hypothetical protein IIC71_09760, partial [Acidobacteria bacterium]|nr:hypothetical protein [Acidobacteriota bacterium]
MKRFMQILVVLSLLIASIGSGSVGASGGNNVRPEGQNAPEARSEHQRIIDFWTVDKVRQAVPRDFVFDRASGRFIPAARGGNPGKPGGGGGGGGGGGDDGDTTVTGAPWLGGGAVVESTGKVLFSLGTDDGGGDRYWVCSASVVIDGTDDRSIAVTAAHCVYENNAGNVEWAKNWMYVPNYEAAVSDSNLKIGEGSAIGEGSFCGAADSGTCWTAIALVLHDGFAEAGGFNGTAIQYDFAFAVLDGALDGDHGAQGINFGAVSKGTFAYDFGYPHRESNGDLILDPTYCAGKTNFDNRFF